MAAPLMPKSTAIWLIENTSLSFEQIAEFCGMHKLEVKAIADSETLGMSGLSPIASLQLTHEEIKRCESDPNAKLNMRSVVDADSILGKKKSKYTPLAKRQNKPDAIYWMLKYYPEVDESQLSKLLGTTKIMIRSIKGKTHWNSANLKPLNPVQAGLCTQLELDQLLAEIKRDKAI